MLMLLCEICVNCNAARFVCPFFFSLNGIAADGPVGGCCLGWNCGVSVKKQETCTRHLNSAIQPQIKQALRGFPRSFFKSGDCCPDLSCNRQLILTNRSHANHFQLQLRFLANCICVQLCTLCACVRACMYVCVHVCKHVGIRKNSIAICTCAHDQCQEFAKALPGGHQLVLLDTCPVS